MRRSKINLIRFVYLDVGGVVVKDFSNTNKWDEFMSSIGVKTSDQNKFIELWKKLDVGIADDMRIFIPLLNNELELNLPDKYDLLSEFTKRFERNESIWPIVSKVKEKYKIGLLTDQYPGMLDDIYKKDLMPDVVFDVVIDSSREKIKKPYPEIYKLAEVRSGYGGSEILFIDNSQKNLDVPISLGWQTFLYDSTNLYKSNRNLMDLIG